MVVTAPPLVLDARSLASAERSRRALEGFDRLKVGERLRVVTDDDPRPLLRHLHEERGGAFEWTPLESEPGHWIADVFRRAANVGELRRVTEALAWDHDRLDALCAQAFAERAAGRLEGARALWGEFAGGLRRHIRFEEEILFPLFEEKTGMPPEAGPTAVMRSEHRDIAALLEGITAAMAAPDATAETLRAQLLALLGGHNDKEEMVLYPGTDRLLSPEESDALVLQIQELAAEAATIVASRP